MEFPLGTAIIFDIHLLCNATYFVTHFRNDNVDKFRIYTTQAKGTFF